MLNNTRANDILRQMTILFFGFVQVLASYFAQLTGIGQDMGSRWSGGFNPAQPSSYAFAIWGIVFPAVMAYAVYQALPAQREHPLLRRIGWYMAAAFILITAWSLLAQLYAPDLLLAILLFGIWWVLVPPYLAIAHTTEKSTADRIMIAFPINILIGWLSVAVFAGFGNAATAAGFTDLYIYVSLVLLAGIVGALFTYLGRGNLAYPLAVVWGLVGVVLANKARTEYSTVTYAAAGMITVILLVLLMMFIAWRLRKGKAAPAIE